MEESFRREIRESCFDCVMKHLLQAGILMLEYRKSDTEEYPLHPRWACAHLAEAEDELVSKDADLARAIRFERIKYQADYNHQIPVEAYVFSILRLIEEEGKSDGEDLSEDSEEGK